MDLADRCKRAFETGDRNRGQSYFFDGAVKVDGVDWNSEIAFADVAGSRGNEYLVEIDWSDVDSGVIFANCDCRRFDDGFLCKHIWATILKLDFDGVSERIPGGGKLRVEPDWDVDEADDDVEEDIEDEFEGAVHVPGFGQVSIATPSKPPTIAPVKKTATRSGKSPSKPTWQKAVEFVDRQWAEDQRKLNQLSNWVGAKDRKAWFILDVNRCRDAGQFVIALKYRERKKDGEFGVPKKQPVVSDQIASFSDPADRDLLNLFNANRSWAVDDANRSDRYGYYSYSPSFTAVIIPPANYEFLLPRIAATGRFVWMLDGSQPIEDGKPVAWDDRGPWQLALSLTPDDKKKRWSIGGYFRRGSDTRQIGSAVLANCGLLLFDDGTLCQMPTNDTPAWLHAVHERSPIEVPYSDRQAFLKQLWSTPSLPPIDWPDNLVVEEVRVPPRPKLTIHAADKNYYSGKNLYADVSFLYGADGEHEVALSDDREGFVGLESKNGEPNTANGGDAKGKKSKTKGARSATVDSKMVTTDRVFLRDRENESGRLDDLKQFPFRTANRYYRTPGSLEFHQKHLVDIVEKLTALQWHVEAEGKLFRSAGAFNIEVTSGIDWFELDAAFDFEGVEAKLPDLLAAVRRGAKYVVLDDGSQGILPAEWLTRYANLANLGETEDGKVRFRPSQALLIDALLAEQDAEQDTVRIDKKFSQFRKRLQSFDGVKPKDPPKTFCGKLRDYQREGLGWFHFLRQLGLGGCLADDMGLGKTVQVLALLENRRTRRLKNGEKRRPSLVIVPKSLVFNWIDEAERFTPRLRIANYTDIDRKERVGSFDDHHIIVTTYGTLRRDIAILKGQRFDYAILDESQAIKNASSQAAKASLLLTADHRLALTGTPIENHLGELWSLFEFLNPGMLGMSSSFASLCRGASRENHESLTDLAKVVAPFILRRTKDQVLKELPAKTEQTLHCELSPNERKAYNELRDYYRTKLTKTIKEKGLNQSKIHVLEALLRLRQASCHLGLVDKKKVNYPSAKLETLLEQVREIVAEGHKALVFSQFTSLLAIVRTRLDRMGIRYEYLDGKTRKRKECVEHFQTDPDCPLFLISLKAGGHGLNLTAADYVFILDPWWNPAVEAQAIDRTHRIGQTRRVFAYRLIAKDTVEEKVLKLQESKRELADAIITANDSLIRKLTADDLKMILS